MSTWPKVWNMPEYEDIWLIYRDICTVRWPVLGKAITYGRRVNCFMVTSPALYVNLQGHLLYTVYCYEVTNMLVCLARRLSIDDDVLLSATTRAQTLTSCLLSLFACAYRHICLGGRQVKQVACNSHSTVGSNFCGLSTTATACLCPSTRLHLQLLLLTSTSTYTKPTLCDTISNRNTSPLPTNP